MEDGLLDLLKLAPPRCLAGFKAEWLESGTFQHVRWAAYEVKCARCGGELFRLRIFLSDWREGEPPAEIGVVAICGGCADERVLFDATRSGYDGEFDHLEFLRGKFSQRPFGGADAAMRVKVEFVYNLEFADLIEFAGKVETTPRDFFDALNVWRAREDARNWQHVWEYECA